MMETGILIIEEKEYLNDLMELLSACGYERQGYHKIWYEKTADNHQQIEGQLLTMEQEQRQNTMAQFEQMRETLRQRQQLVVGEAYLVVNLEEYTVLRDGENVHLTPTEFRIFATLVRSPNRIFSREQLIAYALNHQYEGYDRSIDTYIKSIRKKIEPNRHKPRYIRTVHGLGYKFVP